MPTLTEAQIRAAKPREKPYKLYDSRGLYLLVKPNDGRFWRFKYRFGGKEKLLSFGTYPYVSLKRARDRREEARRLLEDGKDPSAQRSEQKAGQGVTFELVAKEWLELQRHGFAAATFVKAEWMFNDLINPYIGSRPINEITASELLTVFRRLEARGRRETAHRARQRCGQVLRYAIATGRATRDPTADLRSNRGSPSAAHRPSPAQRWRHGVPDGWCSPRSEAQTGRCLRTRLRPPSAAWGTPATK